VSIQIGNNLADKNLVEAVLSGDHQAFGKIIKNSEALVAQIVFKMISNREDRKDLAQEIYLKVFHHLSGFRFQSKLSTWVAQIAYNSCVNWLEKKKLVLPGVFPHSEGDEALESMGHESLGPQTCDTEKALFRKELSEILRLEMSQLPPVYETLLHFYHQEELSYEEIAQITGMPQGTVKSYLFRARKMMKEKLLSKYLKEAL
jgi:RNA polymerase sigma factor (sigma-70 family)